jgi:holliday junction DNA helicase RuvA
MIASLRGKIIEKHADWLLLEVGGVGYKVLMGLPLMEKLAINSEERLLIHYQQREDDVSLYGFVAEEQRDLFLALISVSGVGPKVAMGVLSVSDASRLGKALQSGDAGYLESLPGVGKKTAARLAVELGGKIISDSSEASGLVEALVSLGYSQGEASKALKDIDPSLDEDKQLKEALTRLKR